MSESDRETRSSPAEGSEDRRCQAIVGPTAGCADPHRLPRCGHGDRGLHVDLHRGGTRVGARRQHRGPPAGARRSLRQRHPPRDERVRGRSGDAAEDLRENAALLLGGGTGVSVHGADLEIDVDPASDPASSPSSSRISGSSRGSSVSAKTCWPSSPAIRGSTTWCWICASPARSSPPCRTTPSAR